MDTGSSESNDSSPQVEKGWPALKQHIVDNKIKFGLWVTRLFTIIFTVGYIIPIFGYFYLLILELEWCLALLVQVFKSCSFLSRNPYSIYYKVLMNNAATSALRLHQRVPRVQLTRQFLETLLLEDSCHYLFYSLIFLYAAPVTCILFIYVVSSIIHSLFHILNVSYFNKIESWTDLYIVVLTPVFLFALMHLASYSLTLLDVSKQININYALYTILLHAQKKITSYDYLHSHYKSVTWTCDICSV